MPLVVPGMMGSGTNAQSEDSTNEAWMNRLLGKKLTDGPSDETVSPHFCDRQLGITKRNSLIIDVQNFSKKDLPKEHRIISSDSMMTADHKAERYLVVRYFEENRF